MRVGRYCYACAVRWRYQGRVCTACNYVPMSSEGSHTSCPKCASALAKQSKPTPANLIKISGQEHKVVQATNAGTGAKNLATATLTAPRRFKPFEEALAYARTLLLQDVAAWREHCKSGEMEEGVPFGSCPL